MSKKYPDRPVNRKGNTIRLTIAIAAILIVLAVLGTTCFASAAEEDSRSTATTMLSLGNQVPTGAYLAGPEDWSIQTGDVVVLDDGATPLSGEPAQASWEHAVANALAGQSDEYRPLDMTGATSVATPDGSYRIESWELDEGDNAVLTLADTSVFVYDGDSGAYYGADGTIHVYAANEIAIA